MQANVVNSSAEAGTSEKEKTPKIFWVTRTPLWYGYGMVWYGTILHVSTQHLPPAILSLQFTSICSPRKEREVHNRMENHRSKKAGRPTFCSCCGATLRPVRGRRKQYVCPKGHGVQTGAAVPPSTQPIPITKGRRGWFGRRRKDKEEVKS